MTIEVSNLWKRYPSTWALKDVSFSVNQGKIIGVLGENGSGKSTLFRILAGITHPTKGKVLLFGQPPDTENRKYIAYLPEIQPYYNWMRVRELAEFYSSFYQGWDMSKTRELLEFMNIDPNRKIGELSKGQKGRVKVTMAFSWDSKVVVMDEPLGGIDPPSRKRILQTLFKEFRYGEQTIFVSTHLVSEMEETIEYVIFLKDGEIVLQGDADQLRAERNKSLSEIFEEVGI